MVFDDTILPATGWKTLRELLLIHLALFVVSPFLLVRSAESDNVSVVGSSTVYPFTNAVLIKFSQKHNFEYSIESTGTGAGIDYFCAGEGPSHPDIVNASRRISALEAENCNRSVNGGILEFMIGFDGVVVFTSKDNILRHLTSETLYQALAAKYPSGRKCQQKPECLLVRYR